MIILTRLNGTTEKIRPFLVKRMAGESVGHAFHGNQWTDVAVGEKINAALAKVGLHVANASILPQQAIDELKMKPNLPIRATKDHALAVEGVARSVEDVRSIPVLHDEILNKLKVVIGAYEPKGAGMTMVTGNTEAGLQSVMLLNTQGDPRTGLSGGPKEQFAYAGVQPEEQFRTGKMTMDEAITESYRISALHEYGHLYDRLTHDTGSSTLFQTLLVKQVATDGKTIPAWLAKNISGYAATSLKDAFAEVFSIKMSGGTLPKELQTWWKQVIEEPHAR